MSKQSKLLKNIGNTLSELKNEVENVKEIDVKVLKEIRTDLLNTSDERHQSYTIHSMVDILIITILAILSDCDEWVQIVMFTKKHYNWLTQFLDLSNGIPSKDTFKRVISIIDSKELESILTICLINIFKKYQNLFNDSSKYTTEKDVWSLDGKVCNSSGRTDSKEGKIKPIQAMSVYSTMYDMCIATEFINEKTNEIPTGPELLKTLNLENVIVTFDALNTQEETIKIIVKQGGYYVAAVKGNQTNTYENLVDYFNDPDLLNRVKEENYYCTTEKSHSSIIKYEYYQTEDVTWMYNIKKWRNLKSIGCVKKTITNINTNKITTEIRYYISNLSNNIMEFSNAIRNEWLIENKLHWHLDITFKEDNNSTFEKNAQKNLNIIRKFCLSILKIVKEVYGLSLKNIRKSLCMDFENEIEKIFTYLDIEKIKELTNNANSQCL